MKITATGRYVCTIFDPWSKRSTLFSFFLLGRTVWLSVFLFSFFFFFLKERCNILKLDVPKTEFTTYITAVCHTSLRNFFFHWVVHVCILLHDFSCLFFCFFCFCFFFLFKWHVNSSLGWTAIQCPPSSLVDFVLLDLPHRVCVSTRTIPHQ